MALKLISKNPANAVHFARMKLASARFRLYDAFRVKKTCYMNGLPIEVEAGNPGEFYRIHRYVTREPDTLRWIAEHVQPGDVFYDIGANIGLYSIYAAKLLKGQVQVYSFEPESQNYASLNRNVYINGLSDSVTTLCMAVSGVMAVSQFFVHGELRAGEAIHQFGDHVDDNGVDFVPVHQQGMVGMPLDDLCLKYGLAFPNHIKIDVDGHEAQVILGSKRVLADSRLRSVLIEITETPDNSEEVARSMNTFTGAGFELVKQPKVSPKSTTSTSFNALFVRPESTQR